MREISLHILDIVQNSIVAGATLVRITIDENISADTLTVIIEDNGCGMSHEFVEKVTDPFITKRTTRKVGLGIPLYKFAAENTGGSFEIKSEVGVGTVVTAVFGHSHIDRQPLGNIADTMHALITGYENVNFIYKHIIDGKIFQVNTEDIKNILGDVAFGNPEVYIWLSEFLNEGEEGLSS